MEKLRNEQIPNEFFAFPFDSSYFLKERHWKFGVVEILLYICKKIKTDGVWTKNLFAVFAVINSILKFGEMMDIPHLMRCALVAELNSAMKIIQLALFINIVKLDRIRVCLVFNSSETFKLVMQKPIKKHTYRVQMILTFKDILLAFFTLYNMFTDRIILSLTFFICLSVTIVTNGYHKNAVSLHRHEEATSCHSD